MGFKNAPSVTKYAVGQRFKFANENVQMVVSAGSGHWTVLAVVGDRAVCTTHDDVLNWFSECDMEALELDLTSIWVGREYAYNNGGDVVEIVAVDDTSVWYCRIEAKEHAWKISRDCLRSQYTPLPLEPPWKPEVGKPARSLAYGTVTVLAITQWGLSILDVGNKPPVSVVTNSLLPPEGTP